MEDSSYVLVTVETAHIQGYIFNSNRLKENVGASRLVENATDSWAREAVVRTVAAHNLKVDLTFDPIRHIEADTTLRAEVLYAGGGNFVALFRASEDAQLFAQVLSTRVIQEAPGLHLVLRSVAFDWNAQPLSQVVRDLLRDLKAARAYQPPNIGLAGLGVTAVCHSTGMPAATLRQYSDDDAPSLYSAETVAKQAVFDEANKKLRRLLDLRDEYDFPLDLDHLGRTEGDKSFIAVVHADGNNLGRIIGSIGKVFATPEDNRAYIDAMRDFSENIKVATEAALRDTIAVLQDWCDWVLRLPEQDRPVALDDYKPVVPFRPLVSGGDDVNFICDGRIGLALAALYLEWFGQHATKKAIGSLPERVRKNHLHPVPDTLAACAGVAIVKTHYPFARAYELAEALASEAKKMVRDRQKGTNDNTQYAALDWHMAMTGIYGELEDIRNREYVIPVRVKDKQNPEKIKINKWLLTQRPLYLHPTAHPYRTWAATETLVNYFQTDGDWQQRRSKAKGLMQALRGRKIETQLYEARYLKNVGLALPNPLGPEFEPFVQGYGWYKQTCGYYDALELLDLFVPLSLPEGVVTP